MTIKHTLAVDLGWYPEGDKDGEYCLVAILDNNWDCPILEKNSLIQITYAENPLNPKNNFSRPDNLTGKKLPAFCGLFRFCRFREYYLDGGISDAVPIRKAVADGIAVQNASNSVIKNVVDCNNFYPPNNPLLPETHVSFVWKYNCINYRHLRKHHNSAGNGDSFGCPGYFRMAYCIATEKVERSLAALRQFAKAEYGMPNG